MRTASWEVSAGALAALLASGAPLQKCDLYTLTLPTGAVVRWTSADHAMTVGGHTFNLGPGIERSQCSWSLDVSVDTLTMSLYTDAARPCTIGGLPLLAYIYRGGLQRAQVRLERAFWGAGDPGPIGTLEWFTGTVAEIPILDRHQAQLSIKSGLQALNIQVPREMFQASCLRTVYDAECLVNRTDFTHSGLATSATSLGRTVFSTNLSQATGYFDLGTITITSGANDGVQRSVKSQVGGVITVLSPLPAPMAVNDAFDIVPGCDGLQSTCSGKFNNLPRFKGMPYIPQAETIT